MNGQRHYAIANNTDPDRPQYWRARGNGSRPGGWVYDLSACHYYRKPDDAMRAAQMIGAEPGLPLEVVEIESVVTRVCYRVPAVEIVNNG